MLDVVILSLMSCCILRELVRFVYVWFALWFDVYDFDIVGLVVSGCLWLIFLGFNDDCLVV